mmetsp:Transcript_7882/g.17261  ORF Transcript_7882/g.17261 Transcript_7882/m.17261 type:complete len:209 (+) Transcript_7882:234-860(+)
MLRIMLRACTARRGSPPSANAFSGVPLTPFSPRRAWAVAWTWLGASLNGTPITADSKTTGPPLSVGLRSRDAQRVAAVRLQETRGDSYADSSSVGRRSLDLGRVQQCLRLGLAELRVLHAAVDERDRGDVKLVGRECRRVCCLGQHLDGQLQRRAQVDDLLLVLLLEQRVGALLVHPDARGFPPVVVARRIGLVQLEAVDMIPTRVQH